MGIGRYMMMAVCLSIDLICILMLRRNLYKLYMKKENGKVQSVSQKVSGQEIYKNRNDTGNRFRVSGGGEMAGTEYGIEGSDCHFFCRNTTWNNSVISDRIIRVMVSFIIPVLVHAV